VGCIAGNGWIKAQLQKGSGQGQLHSAGHNIVPTCPHGIFFPVTFSPNREGCAKSIFVRGNLLDGRMRDTAAGNPGPSMRDGTGRHTGIGRMESHGRRFGEFLRWRSPGNDHE
jgi:hypothetical protein